MKKMGLVILLIVICFFPRQAFAEEANINSKNIFLFGSGFMAGLAGHELGHELMARARGVDIEWSWRGKWLMPADSPGLRIIAVAGFGAQILGSEIVLNSRFIPKNNAFVLGYMFWNITNPLIYTLKYELRDPEYNDLSVLNRRDARIVEGVILVHAALSTWRMYKALQKKKVSTHPPFSVSFRQGHQSKITVGIIWLW